MLVCGRGSHQGPRAGGLTRRKHIASRFRGLHVRAKSLPDSVFLKVVGGNLLHPLPPMAAAGRRSSLPPRLRNPHLCPHPDSCSPFVPSCLQIFAFRKDTGYMGSAPTLMTSFCLDYLDQDFVFK